jgi:hypothetical protein
MFNSIMNRYENTLFQTRPLPTWYRTTLWKIHFADTSINSTISIIINLCVAKVAVRMPTLFNAEMIT